MAFDPKAMFRFPRDKDPYIFENPYVDENTFLKTKANPKTLPKYDEIKELLPKPIWDGHGDALDCYNRTWQIAFANLKSASEETRFVSDYIDNAFFSFSFMWDSCFMVMFGKYAGHIFDFQKTLDNFYSHQHKDGYITRQLFQSEDGARFSKDDPASTGPNIFPWAEWEYYCITKDEERLGKVFPVLLAYHKWLQLNRTWQNGLYWTTGLASGMDNQPRVPEGYSPLCSHAFMAWLDACCQQYISADILIKIAGVIGREDDTEWLKEEKELLEKAINENMWDDKDAFYYDMLRDGSLNHVKSVGAYWTLLAGLVSDERADRFISHLDNEKEFKRPFRIPTLSADHPEYQEYGDYWRGSVWAPTNYMVLKGLDKYGYNSLAYDIACNYLENIVEVFKKDGTLYENYSPEHIEKGNHSQNEFVGWTGLAPINIMFEYVFGIRPDAENRKITWHINRLEKHGIENYYFCGKFITLLCDSRSSANEEPSVTLTNCDGIQVEIIWDGKRKTIS